MKKALRIVGLLTCVVLLISIRKYQVDLFFDPYLKFFENKDLFKAISLNNFSFEIMVNVGYRYLLNSTLTLLIIYFMFNKVILVQQSLFVLLMIFVLLFPVYYFFVGLDFKEYTLIGFYVRRIMIQPIILLLLIPSFYYLEKSN